MPRPNTQQTEDDAGHQVPHHQKTLLLWEAMDTELADDARRGAEQRRRLRFLAPDAVCLLEVLESDGDSRIDVVVRDVSASGACLFSATALAVDQAVQLHPPADACSAVKPATGRVVYCENVANRYRIGVQFLSS